MMRDLKRRLGFRPKLGDLAQVNLNAGKSADGLQSLEWYKQGRMDLIEEYCRRDVEVTAQLFFGSRARRYILIRHHLGAAVRLPVDW
jgi:DEAD/DEAH box helicase domain-containing protein